MTEPLRQHDAQHPYVRSLKGCGHGRLFSEPCVDCEIVGLRRQYKDAVQTVMRVRNRLRELGCAGIVAWGRNL